MTPTIEDVLYKHWREYNKELDGNYQAPLEPDSRRLSPLFKKHFTAAMTEYASLNRQGWTRVEDGKVESMPPDCTVVLGYNEKWVDEDFEPEGIRECFYSEAMEEWNSAKWDNDQDHWWNDTETSPTHWMQRPKPPMPLPNKPSI